ncbi:MAG: DUF5606 domain-containing protein [Bacteroidota bacterium]
MSILFKDVVALTGSPGLYQVLKTQEKGIVVESMDERKKRQLVRGNMMVSKLMDVSIYTDDDSEPLVHVMKAIEEKFGAELPVTKKSSSAELLDFLGEVLPSFDRERVYASNVKKLISWYKLLSSLGVAFEVEQEEEEGEAQEAAPAEEKAPEAEEKKPKKKAPAKKTAAKKAESED